VSDTRKGDGERHLAVHPAIVTYALLSVLDYGFTIMAFRLGYEEGNPLLAWYQKQGLFAFAKVGSILAISILGTLFWKHRVVRGVLYAANVLMFSVFAYHLYFWILLSSRR
jgi:hypothetical protein